MLAVQPPLERSWAEACASRSRPGVTSPVRPGCVLHCKKNEGSALTVRHSFIIYTHTRFPRFMQQRPFNLSHAGVASHRRGNTRWSSPGLVLGAWICRASWVPPRTLQNKAGMPSPTSHSNNNTRARQGSRWVTSLPLSSFPQCI